MGVKHFYSWFKKHNKNSIVTLKKDETLPVSMDTLSLDLNGIFHPACQRIFKYGDKYPVRSFLRRPKAQTNRDKRKLNLDAFKEVCRMIDELVETVQPKKRLFLCVDGTAGMSKMNQQRSRRFKSVKDSQSPIFNSSCISPGTQFMDHLMDYLTYHIHKQIDGGKWAHLQVIFSSDKVPGEGEHKIIHLARKYCHKEETFCIYGLDADLIMLGLASRVRNFYIYRDNINNPTERFLIDIESVSSQILKTFKNDQKGVLDGSIVDFIFICCLLGNDFVPQIPGLEIHNHGIDILIYNYEQHNQLVNPHTFEINLENTCKFFKGLEPYIHESLKKKYHKRHKYHRDDLMETFFKIDKNNIITCDYEGYKKGYYKKVLKYQDLNTICEQYIKGLQWVMYYYCKGIPDWNWFYSCPYAPFIDDLGKHLDQTEKITFNTRSKPHEPFFQLLCILPPQSMNLLPTTFKCLYEEEFKEYYPRDIEVDLSGKFAEWEGIVLLRPIPFVDLFNRYKYLCDTVFKTSEWKRNRVDKACSYTWGVESKEFKNRFGTYTFTVDASEL